MLGVSLCLGLFAAASALARPASDGEAHSTPCQPDPHLPRYGLFGGLTDRVTYFGLDAKHQLVESSRATHKTFNASFEVCTALGPAATTDTALDSPVLGRIVLTPSIGGPHTCMTVVNPHDAGTGAPLFARAAPCAGDVVPAVGQRWIYGYISDYGGMFWVGDAATPGHKDGYGILEKRKNATYSSLIVDREGKIELARRTHLAKGTDVLDFEFLCVGDDC